VGSDGLSGWLWATVHPPLNQGAALMTFAVWTLAFVFGIYVWTTGKAKGFGYFLAVWLGPFVIAGTLALLIAVDRY